VSASENLNGDYEGGGASCDCGINCTAAGTDDCNCGDDCASKK
jgi:hypothetical protein